VLLLSSAAGRSGVRLFYVRDVIRNDTPRGRRDDCADTQRSGKRRDINRGSRVLIRVPSTARYVGPDRWVLFGIANCQLFIFVQADSRRHVRRIYWLQFEGYLPSLPKLQRAYTSTRHATLGGMDFYVDTWLERHDSSDVSQPDTRALRREFKPAICRAGLPDLHFHGLRHTAATLPLSQGANPKVVQEMLGHSKVNMTLDTYSHVTPSLQRSAARALDKLMREKRMAT
jgi:integrase